MKSVLFVWLLSLGLLASHVGCCSVRRVGGGCESSACSDCGDCGGVGACASLRSRIADRIRSTNCSSGCGEIYWDEQINEPPVCDPCGCNGAYECGSCRSCPSALGRLRSLWGHRYQPSNCEECSSCGTNSGYGGSGACSTCAANTNAEPGMATSANTNTHVSSPRSTGAPTPAAKPQAIREPNVAPVPVPDANAMFENGDRPPERMAIGSGVSNGGKSIAARSVSTGSKQALQSKPRLVTNPR